MPALDVQSTAALIQALPDAVVLCDARKALVAANAQALTLLANLRSFPELPWQFGIVAADVLLHRVLNGGEKVAIERLQDGDCPVEIRACRLESEPGPYALLLLREIEPGSPTPRTELVARSVPGLAHELRGPLTTISGVAQLLGAKPDVADEERSYLTLVQEQIGRVDRLLRNASAFARGPQSGETFPVSINDATDRALGLLAYELRSHGVQTTSSPGLGLPLVPADAEDVLSAVLSMLVVAIDHLSRGTQLQLCTTSAEDWVVLSADAAPMARPFDPRALSSVRTLATRLGGQIVEQGAPDQLRLQLRLPTFNEAQRFARPPVILVVDRDYDHLVLAQRELGPVAEEVLLATSTTAALRLLDLRPPQVALVDCDFLDQLTGRLPRLTIATEHRANGRAQALVAQGRAETWFHAAEAPAALRLLLRGQPAAAPDVRTTSAAPNRPRARQGQRRQ